MIPQDTDSTKRCCGTCQHLKWLGNAGECHGALIANIYGEMVRPFILSKGYGTRCGTWEPSSVESAQ